MPETGKEDFFPTKTQGKMNKTVKIELACVQLYFKKPEVRKSIQCINYQKKFAISGDLKKDKKKYKNQIFN